MPRTDPRAERPAKSIGEPLWLRMDWPARLVAAALLAGFALRVVGITWGLPGDRQLDSFHPDEWTVYSHAARMAETGDLNPRFFNYGSLPLMLDAAALKLTGAAHDYPNPLGYLVVRLVSLLAGCVTIALAAWIARMAFRSRWAMVPAAWACAAVPVHVQCSHFATVDVVAACLLAASVAFGLKSFEDDRGRWLLLAGLFAGFAAASKYVGILAVLPAAAAYVSGRGSARALAHDRLLLVPLGALVGFALGCPYAFLDFPAFRHDLGFEMRHIRDGATTEMLGKPSLWYFLSETLPCGFTGALLALAVVAALWGWRRSRAGAAVLGGWVVLLVLAHGMGKEIFVRYGVALAPFVAALAGGVGPAWETEPVAGRVARIGGSAVAALCVGYALLVSAATSGMMARPDTREDVARSLGETLAGGGSVGLKTAPWFYTPPLVVPNVGPRLAPEFALREAEAKGIDLAITGTSEGALALRQPEWFVLTEFEYYWAVRAGREPDVRFLAALERDYDLVRDVEGEARLGPIVLPRPRLHDWRYVSPEIRVYRRKGAGAP